MKKGDQIQMKGLNLQAKLLQAWHNRKFDEFILALSDNDCDPKHIYPDEKNQPILGIISREAEPGDLAAKRFIDAVCNTDINVNEHFKNRMYAIQYVCIKGNLSILETLVSKGANVNVEDKLGNTPLHILIHKWKGDCHKKCMEFLLRQQNININVVNVSGFVPIHLAVDQKNKEAVEILLKEKSLQLDLTKLGDEKVTPRQAILAVFPHLANKLPSNQGPVTVDLSLLYKYLRTDEESFCEAFKKEIQNESKKSLLTATFGEDTLLQEACRWGKVKAAQIILSSGADVNFVPRGVEPIRIATRDGKPELLQILLEYKPRFCKNLLNQTILHTLVIHFKNEDNYLKCFDILLKLVDKGALGINSQDVYGCTALFYAALNVPSVQFHRLLNHGAYIGIKDNRGESPLKWIPPKIIEDYLDSLVNETGENFSDMSYTINFNYEFLEPKSTKTINTENEKIKLTNETKVCIHKIMEEKVLETSPLLDMANIPGMRHLLTHPVITSFTFLKWQRTASLFYFNLLFYILFSLLFSGYVIFGYRSAPTFNETESNNYNETVPLGESLSKSVANLFELRLLILIFILFLFLRELFQMAIKQNYYWWRAENWIELFLISVCAAVVVEDCPGNSSEEMAKICHPLCAVSILLVWTELLLLVGKYPMLSIQLEMFWAVSKSYFRYISLYLIILFGFALSFFVLFRDIPVDCNNENPFDAAGASIFKTMIMLTGEFEAGNIQFASYEWTSHLIFAAFLLLIAIVLLNLLHGLAVTDVIELKNAAYLSTCVACVEHLNFIENTIQGDVLSFLKQFTICSYQLFKFSYQWVPLKGVAQKINCFPCIIQKNEISVQPNYSTIIVFPNDSNEARSNQSNYYMNEDTIKAARVLVDKKRNIKQLSKKEAETELCNSKIMSKLEELSKKFDALNSEVGKLRNR